MANEQVFDLSEGASPLVVSIPHDGRVVPDTIADRFTEAAAALPDTDWHVQRLYNFLEPLKATVIAANYSRYVIDLNRAPDGAALYPGRAETQLCPTDTFDGERLYRSGEGLGADEVGERRERYWRPYHEALAEHVARVCAAHGYALLWDAHSIRSVVPRLFDGALPTLSLGTAGGAACEAPIAERVFAVAEASPYSAVLNGRFKGGYITRRYGRPGESVHALQLELAQNAYMDEGPGRRFDEVMAARLRPVLLDMVTAFLDAARSLA